MATETEVPESIINGLLLLSSRENSEECLKEFIEKQLTSREKGFY